jgi:hypothetical protein
VGPLSFPGVHPGWVMASETLATSIPAGESDCSGDTMATGPLQLLVLRASQPDFDGAREQLTRLRHNHLVRVIDAVAVHKKVGGDAEMFTEGRLSAEERVEIGAVVSELIGLGAAGESGLVEGAEPGARIAAEHIEVPIAPEEAWDVAAEIPEECTAVLILIEHRWAIPLRDKIAAAGPYRSASEFISPLDLVIFGMLRAQEAEARVAADATPL